MTPLNDSEARTVARFETAQPAPESWGHAHHWIGTHDHGPVCSVCGIAKPEGGDEGLREALAAALQPVAQVGMRPDAVADALLPVVTAWHEKRVAELVARVKAIPTYKVVTEDESLGYVVLADDVLDALNGAPAMAADRAARNATCCEHAAHDHDTHGCAINLSTQRQTYERCHGLVTVDRTDRGRC